LLDWGELKSIFLANSNHAYYLLADICFDLKDYRDAGRAAVLALQEDPIDSWSWLLLGNSFSKLDVLYEAAQCFLERIYDFW